MSVFIIIVGVIGDTVEEGSFALVSESPFDTRTPIDSHHHQGSLPRPNIGEVVYDHHGCCTKVLGFIKKRVMEVVEVKVAIHPWVLIDTSSSESSDST